MLLPRRLPAKLTWKLVAIAIFAAMGNIIYGYNALSFGGVQAIPAFGKQFGALDKTLHRYALSSTSSSLLTSLAYIGRIIGTIISEPCTKKYGHRMGFFLLSIVTIIGAIIQLTAKKAAQFLVGRIIVYIGVGLVQNIIPTYLSEIVPATTRGFFVGMLELFNVFGGLVASGVNQFYSTFQTSQGWLIPISVQLIPSFIILCGTMFIPQSPRWLIYKGHHSDAIRVLESIRPSKDVRGGLCVEEVNAIEESLQNRSEKRPWLDLFKGTNLRRTCIATIVFSYQQLTGLAFTNTYSTVFYIRVGFASMAFDYTLLSRALSILAVLSAMLLAEYLGRRPVLIGGAFFQAFWLFLMAGMGSLVHPSTASKNMIVAATILFSLSFSASWSPMAFVVAAEVGTWSLREKTMAFSSLINDLSAFVATFTLPYLLNPPFANLQAKVGYIYGSIAASAMFYAFFFVPETKGRSLEELDELFDHKPKLSARKFDAYHSSGIGAHITALERMDADSVSAMKDDATRPRWVHEVRKEESGMLNS